MCLDFKKTSLSILKLQFQHYFIVLGIIIDSKLIGIGFQK